MHLLFKITRLFVGIFFILFQIVHSPLNAQDFFPIKEQGLWGVINRNGETTIKPTYSFIGDFTKENFAIATKDQLSGLINGSGEVLIPLKYKKIRFLNENFLSVCNEEGCALVNSEGQILTPFNFQALIPFNEQLFKTYREKNFGLVTIKGEEIVSTE